MRTTISAVESGRWISEHDPLPVISWDHSGGDGVDFDPRGAYVETYWLAVLGPSAVLAVRRLADWVQDQPSGVVVGLEDLARCLGIGLGTGRHAPVVRTLGRLVMFGLAQIEWDAYGVRDRVPPLSHRQLRAIPAYLAERHDADLRAMAANPALGAIAVAAPRVPRGVARSVGKAASGHAPPLGRSSPVPAPCADLLGHPSTGSSKP